MRRATSILMALVIALMCAQPLAAGIPEAVAACCRDKAATVESHCHGDMPEMAGMHMHADSSKVSAGASSDGCGNSCCCDLLSHGAFAALAAPLLSRTDSHTTIAARSAESFAISRDHTIDRDRSPPQLVV